MARTVTPVSPCFTPGTAIATDRGLRPVEELQRGDKVVTRDNGLMRIEWVGRRDVSYHELSRCREIQPILVKADAFGDGFPSQDMIVSPNHRFLVGRDHAPFRSDGNEVLVAARHLIDHSKVKPVRSLGISYIHIMCNQHQVILAEGAWTESFHPDDQIMRSMGNRQRLELVELFPEIETIGASARFPSARPVQSEIVPN